MEYVEFFWIFLDLLCSVFCYCSKLFPHLSLLVCRMHGFLGKQVVCGTGFRASFLALGLSSLPALSPLTAASRSVAFDMVSFLFIHCIFCWDLHVRQNIGLPNHSFPHQALLMEVQKVVILVGKIISTTTQGNHFPHNLKYFTL